MPYSVKWTNNEHTLYFSGDVTLEDILGISTVIHGDKRFLDIHYRVYDFMNVTSFISQNTTVSDLVEVDRQAASWDKKLKIAILTKDEKILHRAIDFATNIKAIHWQIEMFPTYEDAMLWCKSSDQKSV